MIYYFVTPKCTDPKGNTLYLTAEAVTGTVVVALKNNDPSQLWTPVEYLPGGYDQGFVLLNPGNKMVIASPTNDYPVKLISDEGIDTRATWAFEGEVYGALQLQQDITMNLNVEGSGPYHSGTPVLAWEWGGGNPNEVWTFQIAGDGE